MNIKMITENKKAYMDLLLLGDEQEDMIYRYLDRGELFALYDKDLKSICVVTNEGNDVYELKNIATYPKFQGKGYGKALIRHIFDVYKNKCKTMLVGTGDNPVTLKFYKSVGFEISHKIDNFFTDNYNHPIFENGNQLIDMIYLKKDFN